MELDNKLSEVLSYTNKRGIELAVSTLILIIIGVFILIGLIYAVTMGFGKLKGESESVFDSVEASRVRSECNLACTSGDSLKYCCNDFEISDEKVRCDDERLEIDCSLSCAGVSCEALE